MESPRIQELFRPQGWMSQLVFNTCWNSEEVGSNVSEGLASKARASRHRAKASFSMSLYRLPAEGVAQMKGVSFQLQIWTEGMSLDGLKMCVPN